MDAVEVGRRLAERHAESTGSTELDPVGSLLNYAEAPRGGDWTLRSALVRLAQPNPARVGALLEVMRRLDGPLHHVRKTLESEVVLCDRRVAPAGVGTEPAEPYPDIRTADLARLVAAGLEEADLVAGYEQVDRLEREERLAVPLLAVAVTLDRLASELAAWAEVGPADPPVDAVDRVVDEVGRRLDELGVPVETGPPPGAGGRWPRN